MQSIAVPAYLQNMTPIAVILTLTVVLGGAGLVLRRTSLAAPTKWRVWLALVAGVAVWTVIAFTLSYQGVLQAKPNQMFPLIPWAIVTPIILGYLLITRSTAIQALIKAIPLPWLVGVQVYRAIGFNFLVLWNLGLLPWEFALPAGIGDIIVGVLAITIAIRALGGADIRSAAYAWNIFGILDLVVAVATGFLTSPGLAHLLSPDAPNTLITAYPLVLIPAIAVPMSIVLHIACLWKLNREAQPVAQSDTIMSARV